MINSRDCARLLDITPARLTQLLKQFPEKFPVKKTKNKQTSIPHETVKALLESRGIAYEHTKMIIACQKGGIGKSTITLMTALNAARMGLNVLVLDLDPEANSSQFLADDHFDWSNVKTIFDVFNEDKQILDLVHESKFDGIDFLASSTRARRVNSKTEGLNPKNLLKNKLQKVEEIYDLVLFDVPPSFSKLIASAYLTSDVCIMPVEPSIFSLESVQLTIEDVKEMGYEFDAEPPVFKILKNKLSNRKTSTKDVEEELGRDYGHLLLSYSLKETSHIQNSINMMEDPLTAKGCPSHVKNTIAELCEEFLQRK